MAEEKMNSDVQTNEDAVKEAVNQAKAEAEEAKAENAETEIPVDGPAEEAAEENTEESEEKTESAKEEKTSFFKKKKDKRDEQIEELTDRVKRQMAEFDNFRKRTEKEKSQSFDQGARSVIEKMLPVIDNFERGLAAVPEGESDTFMEGMSMVYKQLMTTMTDLGVEAIEAVGKEFDPDLHNAVMHVDDEAYGENEIVEEFQKGYKFHDAVIRHSMVKVAN